jgi:ribosome biogenesis GTPase
VIGDFVIASEALEADDARIVAVLPRRNVLLRRKIGGAAAAQPIAANVDLGLVVVGLDRPLSLGLLERAVTMARMAEVEPIIVLNKIDLCPDWLDRTDTVRQRFKDLPVLAVSAQTDDGIAALVAQVSATRTATMLGPSGVGKSSLLNRLAGGDAMRTGAVRGNDRRGMHTTTHRELFKLPSGGMLIDGPGMRELGIWGTAEALQAAFPDIVELGSHCARRGCTHEAVSGCAVMRAVLDGRIARARLDGYRALLAEVTAAPGKHRGPKRRAR